MDLYAGLSDSVPDRALQSRPKDLGVTFGNGVCRLVSLPDQYQTDAIVVDSGEAVTSVRIAVVSAYPAPAGGQELLSITEVSLLSRPAR